MPDRDKAISRLQIIRTWAEVGKTSDGIQGEGCLKDVVDWIDDALELLKEQEPRVLTLEELTRHDNLDGCVWFEQTTYNAVAAFVRQDEDYTEIISPYILGEPINHCYMGNSFYGKTWRCWSAKPTDKQREAVPWRKD